MSNTPYQPPDLPNGKWITAKQVTPKPPRKTLCYAVMPSDGSFPTDAIGMIAWYSPWRGYAFFPHFETVFEPDCLGTISGWIETLNQHHRQLLKSRKEGQDG